MTGKPEDFRPGIPEDDLLPESVRAAMFRAYDLAGDVTARFDAHVAKRTPRRAWASNYASGLGDVCLRRVVLFRTRGEEAAPFPIDAARKMERGVILERPLLRLLEEVGIELEQAGVSLGRNPYNIGTRLDNIARWRKKRYVIEMKTIGPWVYDTISTWTDIKNHRSKWVRRYYDQIQPYILLGFTAATAPVEEAGLFLFYDPLGGRLNPIPCPLDYQRAEYLLDRAEEVNAHVDAATLPDFLKDDPGECLSCPFFGRSCFPPIKIGEGSSVFGPDVEEAIDDLKDQGNIDGERARARARRFLMGSKDKPGAVRGVRFGVAGKWLIRGRPAAGGSSWKTEYDRLPEDARATVEEGVSDGSA